MPKPSRNNADRRQWVLNDEGLYSWWTRSNLPLEKFVQDNREQIDHLIDRELAKGPRP
jgi:hypothetical protein